MGSSAGPEAAVRRAPVTTDQPSEPSALSPRCGVGCPELLPDEPGEEGDMGRKFRLPKSLSGSASDFLWLICFVFPVMLKFIFITK